MMYGQKLNLEFPDIHISGDAQRRWRNQTGLQKNILLGKVRRFCSSAEKHRKGYRKVDLNWR